uniref:Si:dkey-3k24.8 n=1 Tax=Denticeps clupeoides TaxID=299321 RepID=A0AAY4AVY0_9TELE
MGMIGVMNCSHMQRPNGTERGAEPVFVSVYALVSVAGIALNLFALVVFIRLKFRSLTVVYMTNLALADLLLDCTLPVRIYYHLGYDGVPQKLCEVMGVALLVNMYGSILLLSCMSLDRCVAVCFPMSLCVREARKKAGWICCGVWVLTVGTSLPMYFGSTSAQVKCFHSFPVYATQTAVMASTLTVGFGIPLTVMLVSSWGLLRAIACSHAAQTELDGRKAQRMVATNMIIFLSCFLPYHLTLWILYLNQDSISCLQLRAFHYSLMVACVNTMLDPLAYYFITETFRKKVPALNT